MYLTLQRVKKKELVEMANKNALNSLKEKFELIKTSKYYNNKKNTIC